MSVRAAAVRARRAGWGRLGHRGLFLFPLGCYDVFYGSFLAAGGALQYPTLIPEAAWGGVWVSVGALLLCGAWVKRDAVFFAAAAGLKMAWALEFVRLEAQHASLEWTRAAYWVMFAVIVVAVAGWPEPP